MIVLGIETSCDETAVGIVDDSRPDAQAIRANRIYSQLAEHAPHGGVVPEIAARAHIDVLNGLIETALTEASLSLPDIDGIAATCGPGLIGGVMVGMMTGKALAAALEKPFLGVNHLEAHLLTARLTHQITPPFLTLLVSGGHSQLLLARNIGDYEILGTTLDDAVGEAFDKSAKLMGLPWPGGPRIEQMARLCPDPEAARARFPLPRPLLGRPGCDLSLSGLKTAMRQLVDKLPEGPLPQETLADLSCSLQSAIGDLLTDRVGKGLEMALGRPGPRPTALVVAGGVAANLHLRTRLETVAQAFDLPLIAPPVPLCTDNGVMVAWAGLEHLRRGETTPLTIAARPRWPLDEFSATFRETLS